MSSYAQSIFIYGQNNSQYSTRIGPIRYEFSRALTFLDGSNEGEKYKKNKDGMSIQNEYGMSIYRMSMG